MLKSIKDLFTLVRDNDTATLLRLFHSLEAPPTIQFLKYGICGVGALIIHTGVYLALIYFVWPEMNDPKMDEHLRTFLFKKGPIKEIEAEMKGGGGEEAAGGSDGSLGIGSLRKKPGR